MLLIPLFQSPTDFVKTELGQIDDIYTSNSNQGMQQVCQIFLYNRISPECPLQQVCSKISFATGLPQIVLCNQVTPNCPLQQLCLELSFATRLPQIVLRKPFQIVPLPKDHFGVISFIPSSIFFSTVFSAKQPSIQPSSDEHRVSSVLFPKSKQCQ